MSTPVVSMIRRTTSSSGSPDGATAACGARPTSRREALQRLAVSTPRRPASSSASPSAGDLGRVDAVGDLDQLVGDRALSASRAAPPGQLGGAPPEQPQVARADRPARPGEQGEQRGVGGDVVRAGAGSPRPRPPRAAGAGRRGRRSRPGRRAAVRASKTSAAWALSRVSTPIVGPRRSASWAAVDLVAQPGQLVGLGLEDARPRPRPRRRSGLAAERRHLAGVLVVERLRPAGWRPRGCGGRSAG